ncbi:amidohydrolase [Sphingosinicella microcystinivorans]|uniref:amidohydrolase n=1 Tax=Sphingosinicella microcystinivorans TaxID=335406 RepID=UPI0022F3AEBB|nr:amidohydrolase [Sphingosinicella microcystinivorans]WBX84214.1 amidohydrolase [Sphingosinicella microcystinivorans]
MIGRRTLLALAGGTAAAAAARLAFASGTDTVDTAYLNAKVWTGAGPAIRTDAIGVTADRIAAVGAEAVRARIGKRTRIVDLDGAFVTPGFIDPHVHFVKAATMLSQPSLRDAADPREFVQRIAAAARALPKGQWLEGGNWDQDRWGGEMPNRSWIDSVTPDTPVAVIRYDLHMLLLNSLALRLAGIDRNTPDVPGGVIERDPAGEPTGIIKDAAKDLVLRAIGTPTDDQIDAVTRQGIAHALSKGVTQVHPTELETISFDSTRRLRARGETGLRFRHYLPLKDWEAQAALIAREGRGDTWVQWGACKVVFDGSLGSRTARFYEPYADEPSTRGILVTDPADLHDWIASADKAGLQVTAHAIGDEANDVVLDTMAAVARANGARDRRFRVEHVQHMKPHAIARFRQQGIIASVQPYHAVDDGRWAVRRIGEERLKTSFAFGSLVRSGAHVCMGSDWPVAPIDPLTGLDAAVNRETLDGKNPQGWYPEQRVTLAEAMHSYTQEGAYAGFNETQMGLIAPGFLADFVVWDSDFFAIDPHSLTRAKVLRTIVGGVQRFG